MKRNQAKRAMGTTVGTLMALIGFAAPAALAGSAPLPPDAVVVEHGDFDTRLIRKPVVPDREGTRVDVWTDVGQGGRVHPGENVRVYFETGRDAYVAVYDIDTRGRRTLLYPSRYGDSGRVRGGTTVALPERGAGYRLMATGPSGIERIVVLASDRPLVDRDGRWIGHRSGENLEVLLGVTPGLSSRLREFDPREGAIRLARTAPVARWAGNKADKRTIAPKLVPVPIGRGSVARAETWFRVTAGWRRW